MAWQFRGGILPLYRGPIENFELFWSFMQAIGIIAAVLAAIFIFKDFSKKIAAYAVSNIWKSFLVGFAAFIAIPAAIFLLFATIAGVIPGIILSSAYTALLTVSLIYSGIIFGNWMASVLKKSKEITPGWLPAVLGAVILFIIGVIPVFGWIIYLFFILAALGSIIIYIYEKF